MTARLKREFKNVEGERSDVVAPFAVQSLAILAVVVFAASFHTNTRRSILAWQLTSLALWGAHFSFLHAWTGAVLIALNAIITIVLMFKGNPRLRSDITLYLCLTALVIGTALTWNGWYSIFALGGVCLITIAKWQDALGRIRIISVAASASWIVYDFGVGSWGGIIAELIIIASILWSIGRTGRATTPEARTSKTSMPLSTKTRKARIGKKNDRG